MLILRRKKQVQERQRLEEMSIRVISTPGRDGLPFKVTIKCPDKARYDHAHILQLNAPNVELGAFVITPNPPRSVRDLVGYSEGPHKGLVNFSEDQLQALVAWASRRHALFPGTNWQALQYEYAINRMS